VAAAAASLPTLASFFVGASAYFRRSAAVREDINAYDAERLLHRLSDARRAC
jgi:hypothetical protein